MEDVYRRNRRGFADAAFLLWNMMNANYKRKVECICKTIYLSTTSLPESILASTPHLLGRLI